jgi:hypothetical protein
MCAAQEPPEALPAAMFKLVLLNTDVLAPPM